MTQTKSVIRPKDRDALIQALRAGVVPRAGQHLIQVGRAHEIAALVGDIDRISQGGAVFRLVTGEYGAGKTFFLNLIRAIAMEKKLVSVNADLNPDRRLHASGGQARSLYTELVRNMSTRAKPDGGALVSVVERFISHTNEEATAQGKAVEDVIRTKLAALTELVNGYDFAEVIAIYYRAHCEGNDDLQGQAIRWLRGEFSTKTDARNALGVRTIVDDANMYDQLKLLSLFVQLAGYGGLLVCLDEMVNLFKLANTQARNANYEQLLRMLNDTFQGNSAHIGFVLGGTPEFLMDTRRGLYSYPALQSRLSTNSFAKAGLIDFSGPVIRLASLSPEDFYVLLQKVRDVFESGRSIERSLPDQAIHGFMAHCATKLGDAYFRTPRTTITSFIDLLAILDQNPILQWEALLPELSMVKDDGGASDHRLEPEHQDELSDFKL